MTPEEKRARRLQQNRESARRCCQKNRTRNLERMRKWREQNPELKRRIMRESAQRRRAEHPEIHRAIQRKARKNQTPEQRANRLRKIAAWQEAHRNEMLEYFRYYNRNGRDTEAERIRSRNRAAWHRQAIGKYSRADIDDLHQKQDGKCAACHRAFPQTGKHRFEIDHIIPLKPRGATIPRGTNWPGNLQLLCSPCNRSKSNRLPDE